MARYLFHSTITTSPEGVSKVIILYALAKQGRNLGAFKLVRHVYEKLHKMHVPNRFQDAIDMGDLTIRAKPFSDSEDLLSLCYRCSTTNPLYNINGNQCLNCNQPFVYSFATFDILPLIEFEIEEGISDVMSLVNQKPDLESDFNFEGMSGSEWQEEKADNYQSLKLGEDYMNTEYNNDYTNDNSGDPSGDPFSATLASYQESDQKYRPVRVSRKALERMKPSEIIVVNFGPPLTTKYYRNLMPDIPITVCQSCFKFFHSDEFEMQETGRCPYCRSQHQRQHH